MPTQIIDPFDREVRRVSRPRRNDGISDDGLSYRVADDYGKLWGQAMEEYDARRGVGSKKYLPLSEADIASGIIAREAPAPKAQSISQQIENPVADPITDPINLESLRHELFDPLTQRFGSVSQTTSRANPAPRTYKVKNASGGDSVIMTNPRTGDSREVFSTPGRPTKDPRIMEDYRLAAHRVAAARAARIGAKSSRQREEAQREYDDAVTAFDSLAPAEEDAIAPPVAPSIPTPSGFIGDPLGENQFALPNPGSIFMGNKDGTKKRLKYNRQSGTLE